LTRSRLTYVAVYPMMEEEKYKKEVLDQDDAWQEVLSKVEKMPLDTTVTFVEDRETGKTAAKIMGSRLASSRPNQVKDGLDKRLCNYCGKKGHGSSSYLERKGNCKALGKACRICIKLHHMARMCFQRPTNIVVVTSDEEDAMDNN
jgi:hypothetical protein